MRMLAEDELRDAVLLIFANKQVQIFLPLPVFKAQVHAAVDLDLWIPPSFSLTLIGSSKRYECCRDHGQVGPPLIARKKLVHSGNLRHLWRWSLRRPRLALQSIEKRQELIVLS